MRFNKRGQMEFSNLITLVVFLGVISLVGILMGVIMYDINVLESSLQTIDFEIPVEAGAQVIYNITHFQDILGIVVYPILSLSTSLPYLTYFMVFAYIIALGLVAYMSTKNPAFFVLHLLFTILITYFAILLSNNYIDLLSNPFINQLMIDFTIYNKLMFYLPQIVFFTSLVFGAIAFINIIKPQSNAIGNQQGLNYGGDY